MCKIEFNTIEKLKVLQKACEMAIQAHEQGDTEAGERALCMFKFAFKHILK
jgi:hypothetical protein